MTERTAIDAAIVALAEGSILLPHVAIVEVTTVLSYVRTPGASSTTFPGPPWRAPDLRWDGYTMPVIDPLVLVDPAREQRESDTLSSASRGARFVILAGTRDPQRLPRYALVVRGTPHPVELTHGNVVPLDDFEATPWLWKVRAAGVECNLLRLDTLEQRLLEELEDPGLDDPGFDGHDWEPPAE